MDPRPDYGPVGSDGNTWLFAFAREDFSRKVGVAEQADVTVASPVRVRAGNKRPAIITDSGVAKVAAFVKAAAGANSATGRLMAQAVASCGVRLFAGGGGSSQATVFAVTVHVRVPDGSDDDSDPYADYLDDVGEDRRKSMTWTIES
jgi:hypothetical protein